MYHELINNELPAYLQLRLIMLCFMFESALFIATGDKPSRQPRQYRQAQPSVLSSVDSTLRIIGSWKYPIKSDFKAFLSNFLVSESLKIELVYIRAVPLVCLRQISI